jgi:hypothetical protein
MGARTAVLPAAGTVLLAGSANQFVSGVLVNLHRDYRVNEKTGQSWHQLVFASGETFELSAAAITRVDLCAQMELTAESHYGPRADGTVGMNYNLTAGLAENEDEVEVESI